MTDTLKRRCVAAWEERGAIYGVLYVKPSEPSLAFVHGYYGDEEYLSDKKFWQLLGYEVSEVFIFGLY